jgi:S1-C subfamily serine protease
MLKKSLSVILSGLFLIFALASYSSCAPIPSSPPTVTYFIPIVAPMAAATVGIFMPTPKGMKVIGTGVVLECTAGKPIKVISAAHVSDHILGEDLAIFVGRNSTATYQIVEVEKKLDKHDLVLLKGTQNLDTSCSTVEVSREFPMLGSSVWVVGYPLGVERSVSHGVLSASYFPKDNPTVYVFRIDAPVTFGNSGGGVFDIQGRLIGILYYVQTIPTGDIFGGKAPAPGGGHAISLLSIWKLLKE